MNEVSRAPTQYAPLWSTTQRAWWHMYCDNVAYVQRVLLGRLGPREAASRVWYGLVSFGDVVLVGSLATNEVLKYRSLGCWTFCSIPSPTLWSFLLEE